MQTPIEQQRSADRRRLASVRSCPVENRGGARRRLPLPNRFPRRVWSTFLLTAAVAALPEFAVAERFQFLDDPPSGTLTLQEEGQPVVVYRYGPQLPDGVPAPYRRSCYLHGVYAADGALVTADFPPDHRHHHGLFWAWPKVRVGKHDTQTWHPSDLHERHVGLGPQKSDDDAAEFSAASRWALDSGETILAVDLTVKALATRDHVRRLQIALQLTADQQPVELLGQTEKGYGGLCFRGNDRFEDATVITANGSQTADIVDEPHRWVVLDGGRYAGAIVVGDEHPDRPVHWLVRRSYAGVLNPSWPGLESATLAPGRPVRLTYEVAVACGDQAGAQLAEHCRRLSER